MISFRSLVNSSVKTLEVFFKKNGQMLASEVTQKERWKICKKCEFYIQRGRFLFWRKPRCKVCGCYLDWKIKADYLHCDKEKW